MSTVEGDDTLILCRLSSEHSFWKPEESQLLCSQNFFFFNKKLDLSTFERRISILKINNTHSLAFLFFCVFTQPYFFKRIDVTCIFISLCQLRFCNLDWMEHFLARKQPAEEETTMIHSIMRIRPSKIHAGSRVCSHRLGNKIQAMT